MIVKYSKREPFVAFTTTQPKGDLLLQVCDSWIAPEVNDEDFQGATFISAKPGMFAQEKRGYIVRRDFLAYDNRWSRLMEQLSNPEYSDGNFYKVDENWEVFKCSAARAEESYVGYVMATNTKWTGFYIKPDEAKVYYRIGGKIV